MTTEVLGSLSFLEVPTVTGQPVLLNAGGVPLLQAGTLASRPAAGNVGALYIDTTNNLLTRDNGATWDTIGSSTTYSGTANEIVIAGSLIGIADNPVLPGTARVRLPIGTTAQRPGTPTAGDVRFNTTTGFTEGYTGANWSPFGRVLQFVSGNISATTGSTQVPFDNSVPTSAQGIEIWASSFTPVSATSRIVVSHSITVASSNTARTITCSIFSGTTNRGASAVEVQGGATSNNQPHHLTSNVTFTLGSTATVTISSRAGLDGSGTFYVNQTSAATLGGALVSQYSILEIE